MTTGPSNFYDLATTTLAAVVAAYADAGVTPPARQYVTTGTPVGECDALVVSWESVWAGRAHLGEGVETVTPASTLAGRLSVTVFRCGVPGLTNKGMGGVVAPTPEQYNTYAAVVMTDAYVVPRGLIRARQAGTFATYCTGVVVGPATPLEPEGAMAGVRVLVAVDLN